MGSCFFIGHRETPDRVYPTLLETIERHITEYGVSEFVVGQYGSFDRLVIRALSQAKRAHPDITLMLMTPYYPVNRKVDLPEEFDALFYPPDLETVPKRLAIIRANRYMVERSDFLIAYVRHPASNAKELLEYGLVQRPAQYAWKSRLYFRLSQVRVLCLRPSLWQTGRHFSGGIDGGVPARCRAGSLSPP